MTLWLLPGEGQPVKLQNSFLAVLAAVLPACLSYAYFADLGVHDTQFEDSYITYRYALNLAAGNGLVFSD